jgi:hypothetical protein
MNFEKLQIATIARICHEANRVWCESLGDNSQRPWDQAEDWQRQSAVDGVQFALMNPEAPASAQHEAWLKAKKLDGWKWGRVKDAVKKDHPCLVPYHLLPADQKLKDFLFRGIVKAFVEAFEDRRA